jgi:hypothetical protein
MKDNHFLSFYISGAPAQVPLLGKVMYQINATIKFIHLNMFRASICPSSGEQCSELPHMMCNTVTRDTNHEVWCCGDMCCGEVPSPQHQTSWFVSVVTVQHITCGSSLHCTPDDGHIDARNMLRWINFIVASIWYITFPSFMMHGHMNVKFTITYFLYPCSRAV